MYCSLRSKIIQIGGRSADIQSLEVERLIFLHPKSERNYRFFRWNIDSYLTFSEIIDFLFSWSPETVPLREQNRKECLFMVTANFNSCFLWMSYCRMWSKFFHMPLPQTSQNRYQSKIAFLYSCCFSLFHDQFEGLRCLLLACKVSEWSFSEPKTLFWH